MRATNLTDARTVVQVTAGDRQGTVTLDPCLAADWEGKPHELTADVLYWVLSPGWSGGVSGDLPMLPQPRQ